MKTTQPGDDAKLVERCISGDRSAWGTLYQQWSRHLTLTVRQTLRTYNVRWACDAVEDHVASLFIKLLDQHCRKLRSWRGDASLKTWLRVFAANATIDVLRSSKNLATTPFEELDDEIGNTLPLDSNRIDATRQLRFLFAEREQLNAEDTLLFDRYLLNTEPAAEVAQALGINHGALYTRTSRLRSRLRNAIESNIHPSASADPEGHRTPRREQEAG